MEPSLRRGALITELRVRSNHTSELASRIARVDLAKDSAVLDVLSALGQRYNANCVLLILDGKWTTCAAMWGQPFEYEELEALDAPRLFRTIPRKLPTIINDIASDPTLLQGVSLDPAVKCYVSSPVCLYGDYLGSVVMTCSKPQELSLMRLEYFQDMTSRIGTLIEDRLKNVVVSPEAVDDESAQKLNWREGSSHVVQ